MHDEEGNTGEDNERERDEERKSELEESPFGRRISGERATRGKRMVDLPLYIRCRALRGVKERRQRKREPLAARALYYIIGGHFGPPKLLSEHKKYEVLLGPPFFRAASGAARRIVP